MRILAVVVTHNRCALLARCVDALAAQHRPADEVVVINNGSTDDTEAMLRARGVRCLTQENVGSAGGWHRGLQVALDEGFDAVWLMDDDGYPASMALGELERALTPERAAVSSVVLCEDAPERFVFPFPVLGPRGLPVLLGRPRKLPTLAALAERAPEGTYPFAHFFNGALIATRAVRQVGNVEPAFFIFGDEVDYFFRLRTAGAVVSVLAAHHLHPDVSDRPYTPAKVYYYVKNTLILNRRYLDLAPLRDLLTLAAVLVRTARRNGLAEALSYVVGPRAPALARAVLRGWQGRVGRDLDG